MLNKKDTWNKIKTCIRSNISESEFNTWFSNTTLKKFNQDLAVIEVPNKYVASWLHDNYISQIRDYFVNNFSFVPEIHFTYRIYKVNNTAQKNRLTQGSQVSFIHGLNPSFKFKNFIKGNFNEFAYSSALDVAKNPGKSYNPLYIFSKMSLGKTHLINAIGNYVLFNNISTRIRYVPADRFSSELSLFSKNGKINEWRQNYRKLDFLIIDDIHRLSGREKSQVEFISLFNTYHKMKRQIVVSANQPPGQIKEIIPQLTSRLEWGLLLEIQIPDQKTKIKIIREKTVNQNISIPDDVSFFLAKAAKDLKTLTQYLVTLETYASLYQHEIDMSTAKSIIKDKRHYDVSISDIQTLITGYFNITLSDLLSDNKRRMYSYPRQIAMYLCRKLINLSFNEIGKAFGNKDHSTVIYAVKRIEKDMDFRKEVSDDINRIQSFFHEP